MEEDIHEYPIDGVLDLHMFRPAEVKSVLEEYIFECRKRGIFEVRIVHGKGQGTLRNIVRSFCDKSPLVASYQTAPDSSGWGATIAVLEFKKQE